MRPSDGMAGASAEVDEAQPGLLKRILHRSQSKKNPRRPSTTSLPGQQRDRDTFATYRPNDEELDAKRAGTQYFNSLAPVDEQQTEGNAQKVENNKKRSLRFRFRSASVPATDVVKPTFSRTYVPKHAAAGFERTTSSSAQKRAERSEVAPDRTAEGPSDFELFMQKAQEEERNEKDDLLQSLARGRNRKTFVPDHPDVNFMFGDPKSRRRSGL